MSEEEKQEFSFDLPSCPANSNFILSKSSGPQPSGPKPSGPKPSGPKPSGPKPRQNPSLSATENAFFSLPIWAQWLIKILVFFLAITGLVCGIFTCKARNKYRLNSMIAGVILM